VTLTAVYVYDTQHPYPLARVGGLHFACINDATWSADGRMLTVCSSDGYLTFIKFAKGALGELLPIEQVPDCVKTAFPCLYHKMFGVEPPAPVVAPPPAQAAVAVSAVAASVAVAVAGGGAAAAPVPMETDEAQVAPPTPNPALSAPERDSETKKRRIAPTVLGPPGAAGSFGNLVGDSVGPRNSQEMAAIVINAQASAAPSLQAVAAAAVTADKKKRRITPVLVTQSLPVEIAVQPAEAFSAGPGTAAAAGAEMVMVEDETAV